MKAHAHDIHLYGGEWANGTPRTNAKKLSDSHCFAKIAVSGGTTRAAKARVGGACEGGHRSWELTSMSGLKTAETAFHTSGSQDMSAALRLVNQAPCKTNYYTDKFDTTAWNDFGAQPREKNFASTTHQGSLHRYKNLQKIRDRLYCQDRMDFVDSQKPHFNCSKNSTLCRLGHVTT